MYSKKVLPLSSQPKTDNVASLMALPQLFTSVHIVSPFCHIPLFSLFFLFIIFLSDCISQWSSGVEDKSNHPIQFLKIGCIPPPYHLFLYRLLYVSRVSGRLKAGQIKTSPFISNLTISLLTLSLSLSCFVHGTSCVFV